MPHASNSMNFEAVAPFLRGLARALVSSGRLDRLPTLLELFGLLRELGIDSGPGNEELSRALATASPEQLQSIGPERLAALGLRGPSQPGGSPPLPVAASGAAGGPERWVSEWRAWAASHRALPARADDSREAIYAGRGE